MTYDVLGMFDAFTPKFAKKYADFNTLMSDAFAQYRQEVLDGAFPSPDHEYGMSDEVLDAVEAEFGSPD